MSGRKSPSANRFRFRAWNEKNSNPAGRMIFPAAITAEGKVIMPDGNEWGIPVMQSTGLTDKNGKEVFEGDIVLCEVDEAFQETHGKWVRKEVLYRNGQWVATYLSSEKGVVLPRGYSGGPLVDYRGEEWKDSIFEDDERYRKITVESIGNIYENPELLPAA